MNSKALFFILSCLLMPVCEEVRNPICIQGVTQTTKDLHLQTMSDDVFN